ncbi:MAG: UDP-N-acetylmuramoyl-L-alanyl-D-glutamate--2,6-diaminopimelate ligase [Planctomycetota bacterium]
MRLKDLLKHIRYLGIADFRDIEIGDVVNDSRHVHPGDVFVAIRGIREDGAKYASDAAARGAVAVVAEGPVEGINGMPLIVVDDARIALSGLSAAAHDHPSTKLEIIGITGTNGKTSVSLLIRSILKAAGIEAGLLGTISYDTGLYALPAPITTPESSDIQRYLAQMAACGLTHAVMEVSSHALAQGRVRDVDFDAGVFTNFSAEHLDYHGDIENYFDAKAELFRMLKPEAHGIINADDPRAARLAAQTRAAVTQYGLEHSAPVSARIRGVGMTGSDYTLLLDDRAIPVSSPLPGRHNILNALAAAAVCLRLGIDAGDIRDGIEAVRAVPGRLERVEAGQPFDVFVDYAHTEDALNTVLAGVRPLVRGRLITVFGCGGDRDRSKRAPMAAAAERWSDRVVLTSDNPRSEDPPAIIEEIRAGFSSSADYVIEPDRAAAIEAALQTAQPGDLVLIAGKGHETVQKFADGEIPFDDRAVALRVLEEKKPETSAEEALGLRTIKV